MKKNTTVYVLQLEGSPENSGSTVIFEIAGMSTNRKIIEDLKVEKDRWLDSYLGPKGDDEEDDDDDRSYTLYNTDMSERPEWVIVSWTLT